MSIKTAVVDGVATIEIARPEKKNAITRRDVHARWPTRSTRRARTPRCAPCCSPASRASSPRATTSRTSCSARASGRTRRRSRFMKALIGCDKPVVAAVTGAAIGIGTTMLLHCDFVYVSDEARLAMPFVSLGLVPEFASSLIVPQLMGNARAAEKLLLGDPFTGADAVECGIANAVLPASEVVKHARRIAERFNALPPGAVRETKRLMRRGRAAAMLETIGVEGERLRRAPAKPGSEGSVQCLLREAQARLLAASDPGAAALARSRRGGARASRSRSRRCSSRRRWRRGGGRRCCPRRRANARAVVGGGDAPTLRLLVAGDSSAAGVGVARQEQAVVGHLVRTLHRATGRPIAWALRARTGLTTRGVHALLVERAAVRGRRRRRHHRRQRRHRPGDDAARGARPRRARRLAARPGRRAPRRLRAAAADASLPAPARAAAPRPGRRRAPPRRRAGALGGDAQRRLARRASRSTSTPPAWRATAFIPASRSTAPAARRSPRTSRGCATMSRRRSEELSDVTAAGRCT